MNIKIYLKFDHIFIIILLNPKLNKEIQINEALKFVFNRLTVRKSIDKYNLFLNKEIILTKQIKETLSSGQVIKIII